MSSVRQRVEKLEEAEAKHPLGYWLERLTRDLEKIYGEPGDVVNRELSAEEFKSLAHEIIDRVYAGNTEARTG